MSLPSKWFRPVLLRLVPYSQTVVEGSDSLSVSAPLREKGLGTVSVSGLSRVL